MKHPKITAVKFCNAGSRRQSNVVYSARFFPALWDAKQRPQSVFLWIPLSFRPGDQSFRHHHELSVFSLGCKGLTPRNCVNSWLICGPTRWSSPIAPPTGRKSTINPDDYGSLARKPSFDSTGCRLTASNFCNPLSIHAGHKFAKSWIAIRDVHSSRRLKNILDLSLTVKLLA